MSDLNDPRVFFAAERSLLAWNRTGLALMAFGFMVERFGLFLHVFAPKAAAAGRDLSFWIGIAFILTGTAATAVAAVQFRRFVKPAEIPPGYWVNAGVLANAFVAAIGIALSAFLFLGILWNADFAVR